MLATRMLSTSNLEGVSVLFLASATDGVGATIFTETVTFGDPAANRSIIVGIGGQADNNITRSVASVTIGGVTASEIVDSGGFNVENRVYIFAADVPSGTSGDVVVTWSGAMFNSGIGVWRATNISLTPHDTLTDIANPLTGTINIPADGICVAHAYSNGGPFSWTGLTEDYDDTGLDAREQGGASDYFASEQIGRTISASIAGGPLIDGFAVASFGK